MRELQSVDHRLLITFCCRHLPPDRKGITSRVTEPEPGPEPGNWARAGFRAAVSAQARPAVRASRSARAGDPVMGLRDVRHWPRERHHTRTRDVHRGGCGALVAGGTVDAALVARRPATALPACHPPGADGLTPRYVGRIRRGRPPAVLPAGARRAVAGVHRPAPREFRVPYRLAGRRPYVGSGRRLLIDLQDRSHLDPEFCLVAATNGQVVLTAPGEEFYERVDWSGDEPAGWRPHEDPDSPVRINPLVRFGMPAVRGISTEAIAGELDGGASPRSPAGWGRPYAALASGLAEGS